MCCPKPPTKVKRITHLQPIADEREPLKVTTAATATSRLSAALRFSRFGEPTAHPHTAPSVVV